MKKKVFAFYVSMRPPVHNERLNVNVNVASVGALLLPDGRTCYIRVENMGSDIDLTDAMDNAAKRPGEFVMNTHEL